MTRAAGAAPEVSADPVRTPVVIEAAVTPYRPGSPLQTADEMVEQAVACLEAGAGIIHHHHDFRLDRADAITQICEVERAILTDHPSALLYADYLRGTSIDDKYAYLEPLHAAGLLRMFALDPGHTMFDITDDRGLPADFAEAGFTYAECDEMVGFANRVRAPISLGIYEPGHLRWARAYAIAGQLPPGCVVKLYLPDSFSLGGAPRVSVGLYPTIASVDMYLSMLAGADVAWQVSIPGGVLLESPIARYSLERGGHLRVGIEDTGGRTAMSNVETVERAVALAAEVGRPVARGAQASAALAQVPGRSGEPGFQPAS